MVRNSMRMAQEEVFGPILLVKADLTRLSFLLRRE